VKLIKCDKCGKTVNDLSKAWEVKMSTIRPLLRDMRFELCGACALSIKEEMRSAAVGKEAP
jgi:hypothetical protein